MADMFTITRTFDRDEILADVQRVIDLGGDIYKAKSFLDQMYNGWSYDSRTYFMVELMFRDENDPFFELFTRKLAELDEKE